MSQICFWRQRIYLANRRNICGNIESIRRKTNVHSNRSSKNVFGKQTDRFEVDKQWKNKGGQGCQSLPNAERGN